MLYLVSFDPNMIKHVYVEYHGNFNFAPSITMYLQTAK